MYYNSEYALYDIVRSILIYKIRRPEDLGTKLGLRLIKVNKKHIF